MNIVSSKDIHIRNLEEFDLEFLVETRNDCRELLHNNREFSLENAFNWFYNSPSNFFVIEIFSDRAGYFRTSNWDFDNKHVCIGCDIHRNFRRKGIAYISYNVFMDHLFKKYEFSKIWLEVLSINIPAINLYRKLGFTVDGVKRKEIYRDGKYIDSIIMSVLKEEWKNNEQRV